MLTSNTYNIRFTRSSVHIVVVIASLVFAYIALNLSFLHYMTSHRNLGSRVLTTVGLLSTRCTEVVINRYESPWTRSFISLYLFSDELERRVSNEARWPNKGKSIGLCTVTITRT